MKKQRLVAWLLCAATMACLVTTGAAEDTQGTQATDASEKERQAHASEEEAINALDSGNPLFFVGGSGEEEGVVDNGDTDIDIGLLKDKEDLGSTETGKARVFVEDARLRAEPSKEAEELTQLAEGTTVEVVALEGEWYRTKFGIMDGFVHQSCLFVIGDDGRNGTILHDGTVMRESPDAASAEVSVLSCGNGVQVTDFEPGWYAVTYAGKSGYVAKEEISVTNAFSGETDVRILKKGMSGQAVVKAQEELIKRGFLIGTASGTYDDATVEAVKTFQKAADTSADGVAGGQTLASLYGDNDIILTISEKSQVKGRVEMTEWSEVNKIIPRGAEYTVIDVKTGKSWKERRLYGHNHIDSEPLTQADTDTMKSVYGGYWSWDRRAVWVVYGNRVFAASINGMPHGGQSITSNGFNGHHCIHFYKSKTHCGNKQCPIHQAMVLAAYREGN